MLHKMRDRLGRRASIWDHPIELILAVLLLILLIIVLINYINPGLNNLGNQTNSCENSVPKGVCTSQDTCSSHSYTYRNTKDCGEGVCCLTNGEDISAGSYGGDSTKNFEIESISVRDLAKVSGCDCIASIEKSNIITCPDDSPIILCKPDTTVNLVVDVKIKNGPTDLSIYANPKIVNSYDNSYSFFQGPAKLVKANDVADLTAEFQITKTTTFPSGEGNTHTIYASAKSSKAPQIFVSDETKFITITFKATP